jgi:hypothetical protein
MPQGRTIQHKLLCPETVWSIPVSSCNQEGYRNGTPSHTFHPKQDPKLFASSESTNNQIHFREDLHVELKEDTDYQHLHSTYQLGSTRRERRRG